MYVTYGFHVSRSWTGEEPINGEPVVSLRVLYDATDTCFVDEYRPFDVVGPMVIAAAAAVQSS